MGWLLITAVAHRRHCSFVLVLSVVVLVWFLFIVVALARARLTAVVVL